MRICFLTNTPYNTGGVERVLAILANELAKNNSVTILCTDLDNVNNVYGLSQAISVKQIADLKNKKYHYFFRRTARMINSVVPLRDVSFLERIYFPEVENKKFIKALNKQFDCVIGVQFQCALQLAVIADRLNCKCVGWLHNSCSAHFQTKNRYSWHREPLFREYMGKLTNCVCLTDHDQREFTKLIGPYFKRIYNPLTCMGEKEDCSKDIDVLFVGRLTWEQKGLDLLIEIIHIAVMKNENLRCVVVGTGSDAEKFDQSIKQHNLSEHLIMVGEKKEVADYYHRSKVVINTSRWEGFGLTITEAMNFGVPVVAFRTTGPSEIIEHEKSGLLIEKFDTNAFADAILEIMNDKLKWEYLSENAKKRSSDFSLDKIIMEWKKIIE